MKLLKLAAVLLSLALLPSCFAQGITFTDKSGKMTLKHIANWSTRLIDADTLHFKATGSKLNGEWPALGMTVDAQTIEGDAKRTDGALHLIKATVTGAVHVVVHKGTQTVTTDSANAVITTEGDGMNIVMSGHVTLDSESAQTGESVIASGDSGTAKVSPIAGLGKASLIGTVKLDMTRRSAKAPTHVIAHAHRMDIDRAANPATVVLEGDVLIQGNDPVVAGEIRANAVTITLDAQGQPVGVDADGEPGVMRFKERGGGN